MTAEMDPIEYQRRMLERTALCFDQKDLAKIAESTISIAGLGGVGAITAELLARWGATKFRLLDKDKYEFSNLNRQLFATSKTIEERKVNAAAARIREINPYAQIEQIVDARVDNENVHKFVKGANIIIQNTDHPSSRLFYHAARQHKVPLVNGYATITGGRIQSFDYRSSPCRTILDAWWDRTKFAGLKPIEEMNPEELDEFDRKFVHSTAPSVNFVTNAVGCFIVAEAVKLLTGRGKPVLYPKYLEFDLFNFRMATRSSYIPDRGQIRKVFSVIRKRLAVK
jgi:tRNA A37 threonylcarbamoyladenosine dehydratase